jgi:hypothetical protein
MKIGGSGFAAIALLGIAGLSGCADYQANTAATRSIWSVRVVKAKEVGDCRALGRVDSRDAARGCGLTVQPTPEECLRFQVRRAGGDTLVMNGPVGDAYDCSGGAAPAVAAAAPPAAAPTENVAAPAAVRPTPIPTSPSPSALPAVGKRARVVSDHAAARGCVYVGDLDPKSACGLDMGSTEDCLARVGAESGGDTVVWDRNAELAQVFNCSAQR